MPRGRPRYVRPRPALPGAAPAYVSGRSRRGGAGLAEGQGAGRGKGQPKFTQVTDTVSLEMRFISFFLTLLWQEEGVMLVPQAAGALPVPGAGAVELGFSRVSCPASTAFPQGPGVFQYHCDKSCKLASA